jgi:hypothetical protein
MKILFLLIALFVLFVSFVWYLEETSVFFPAREITATPRDVGLKYEDVYFKTKDGLTLNAWFVPANRPYGTVLFFHGNAGSLSERVGKMRAFHELRFNILGVDYRGYGRSEGKPSEKGIYLDAQAACDYLLTREDVDPKKIIIYGVSLGGAVAVDLAARRPAAALIVDSSFSSAWDMAKWMYPFVPYFLVRTKMNSEDKIKSVQCPKLFIHSRDDDMVPYSLGMKLAETAPEPKLQVTINGPHNEGHDLFFGKGDRGGRGVVGNPFWKGIEEFFIKYNIYPLYWYEKTE